MENKDQPVFAAMSSSNGIRHKQEGLTKRELIASMMAQGMLSNPEIIQIMNQAKVSPDEQADFLSIAAIEQADSLLSQLLSKP